MKVNKALRNDLYTVITFPEIQRLQEIDGFKENSSLINDEPSLSEYGISAYFVRLNWILENYNDFED